MRRFPLTYLALLLFVSACDEPQQPPEGYIERPIGFTSKEQGFCANWSLMSLTPMIVDEKVVIKNVPDPPSPQRPNWLDRQAEALAKTCDRCLNIAATHQDGTGWLVGFNGGEWGGSLWRFQSGKPPTQIADGNISRLFEWNGQLYAAGGLAHLGLDEGFVIPLRGDGADRTRALRRIDTGSSVSDVVVLDANRVMVITFRGPRIVRRDGTVRRIPFGQDWQEFLYPRSAVRAPNGDIYIGLGYVTSHLRMKGQEVVGETWLVPSKCRSFRYVELSKGDCECLP